MRVERGAAERILVSLFPLETITQSINGAPKLVRYCGVRIRLEIRLYVSEAMMERRAFGCACVVQCVELCRNPPLAPRSITAGWGF